MNAVRRLLPALAVMRSAKVQEAPEVTDVAPAPVTDYAKRMEICARCEFSKERRAGILQCTKCGCVCQVKAGFKRSTCPINKW